MFCPKCGNELMEGALFCDVCGTKLNAPAAQTTNEKVEEIPAEQPVSAQPAAEPVQAKAPAKIQPAKKPPKKKNTALIVIIAVAATLVVAATAAFLVFKFVLNDDSESSSKKKKSSGVTSSETVEPTETPSENSTVPSTEKPSEDVKVEYIEPVTEPATQPVSPPSSQDYNSVGNPKTSDFGWLNSVSIGGIPSDAEMLSSYYDILGSWKAIMSYDTVSYLYNVEIEKTSSGLKITAQPYTVVLSGTEKDISNESAFVYDGEFTGGTLTAYQGNESASITFYQQGSKQYGVGATGMNQSGEVATVGFVRP